MVFFEDEHWVRFGDVYEICRKYPAEAFTIIRHRQYFQTQLLQHHQPYEVHGEGFSQKEEKE